MESLLVTADGLTIRQAVQPPAGVLALVKAQHEHFGLRYAPFQRAWFVTWTWDANDPRRRHVQGGRTVPADAHDIVCELPADCPLEQAANYIAEHCIVNPSVNAWRGVVAKQQEANARHAAWIEAQALAGVTESIEHGLTAGNLKQLREQEVDEGPEFHVEHVSPDEMREIREATA